MFTYDWSLTTKGELNLQTQTLHFSFFYFSLFLNLKTQEDLLPVSFCTKQRFIFGNRTSVFLVIIKK